MAKIEQSTTIPADSQACGEAAGSHDGDNISLQTGWQTGVLDALTSHIAVLDKQGVIVAVNRAWARFASENGGKAEDYGVGVNYLAAVRAGSICGDSHAAAALAGLNAVLIGKDAQFELEYPCHSPTGERWFLMQASPLPDTQGCVVSHLNITKRKQAERDHSRLVAILEATTDFVGMADEQGRVLYRNRALRQIRGRGLSSDDSLDAISDNHPEWAYRKVRDEGMPEAARTGAWAGETALLDASGQEIPVHQVILAHRDESGKIDFYSTIMRDRTAARQQELELRQAFDELKHAHDQLVQSEKMASIGQLAAGVAHEINNPIGYLHSNLGTLGQYLDDTSRVVEAYEAALPSVADPVAKTAVEQLKKQTDFQFVLEDIPKLLAESQEGIRRVRKIVQDLKDFAHTSDNEEWQWVDLRHSLSRTLSIVHNELKYKAEVVQSFEDIPEIRCLPGQLNQVFMNLLVNAAHAIDEHGEVRIATRQQGEHLLVEISDTGCGMPPEVVGRIFEPFFTTKPVGKGTGLGLSISYGIVKKHGGHIEVDSQVGQGTTFRIVLPIAGPDEVKE
jgi:PAS domain S-box-containing protein